MSSATISKLSILLGLTLCLAITGPIWANEIPVIEEVYVVFDNAAFGHANTIHILGDLPNGGEVIVQLGQSGTLPVLSLSNTHIVALCPSNCDSGDYLLSVQTASPSYMMDTYNLTIGALGLQGPAGPQGPQGPAGDPATDTSAATECGDDEVLLGDGSCLSVLDLVCSVLPKTVFVTSSRSKGHLGGLAGADATCNSLAQSAGLSGHYKAWLSDSDESPSSRFVPSTCPYYRVDGVKVADDWNDLTDGSLDTAISVDENGVSRLAGGWTSGELVWTNTDTDGTAHGTTVNDSCADWTLEDNTRGQYGGSLDQNDSYWTQASIFIGVCSDRKRLYCIQQ